LVIFFDQYGVVLWLSVAIHTFTHCVDGERTIATESYNINPTVRLNKISVKNCQYKTWCKEEEDFI